MILIDYSAIAIAPLAIGACHYEDTEMIRHMILNSIRMHRTKFKKKYGEVVIIADGGGNWRKKLYPQYKGKRASHREESKIDWKIAFENIDKVFREIGENFPYKTIRQWGCEADDTIAELVHLTQEFGRTEPVMIISADKDFIQLQKYQNVDQFSTVTKKPVRDDDPILYRANHIIKGCPGDGVPCCLEDDDQLMEGRKKQVLSKTKREQLIADPKCFGPEVYRNWMRNKVMIDLLEDRHCPIETRKEIINSFETQVPPHGKVLNYLIKNNCRRLLDNVAEFIN